MYLEREPILLEEAKKRLEKLQIQPKKVMKKIEEAQGFFLAEDIHATFPIPAFRRSGYDGYGILLEDDHDFPREFDVLDNIGAGDVFEGKLKSGQAVRIMTGAKVPDEVGKVIMLEVTELLDHHRVCIKETMPSSNIAAIGSEIAQDEVILRAGTRLNAGAISLLAAFGWLNVAVYDKPKIGILATGSELLYPGQEYENGKIYNSNGPLLAGLAKESGATVVATLQVADDFQETKEKLQALVGCCDLVLTTGGVSVGDFDFMAELAKTSDEFLFNKLAMRPGSPTTAFVQNNTPVIALSGNPSACFTGFYFFAEPLIQRFHGQTTRLKRSVGQLSAGYHKKNSFDRYLHGVYEEGKVTLDGHGQSSELGSLHQANCFFKVPRETTIEPEGEVEIWFIPRAY